MYEKLEQCPSCKHTQFTNHIIVEDQMVTHESFALVKCTKCDLIFTNPRPLESELPKYYKSDTYISHTSKGNSLINSIYKLVRSFTLKGKRDIIKSKKKDYQSLLDYGCGTGHFLGVIKKQGKQIAGIEPDANARQFASEQNQQDIHSSIDEVSTAQKFDVITAWHVLEHVSDLNGTLSKLSKHLNKDGLMFIGLPNHQSLDAQHYGKHWAAYDVPRHLYHFNPDSVTHLAKLHKLKVIDQLPMYFDSYYVSMLSEKYQTGNNNYFKAFVQGMKSNTSAHQTGQYSSIIYILSK